MPPGGGVPPPYGSYDPKTQWRAYREQQKAAWRAQRDAWKAQRYAYKAQYGGSYGPRVPSLVGPVILIAIGILALLMMSGRINADEFWAWYGHWWPLMLIAAGLALLGEWALDIRRKVPMHRGGSYVGLIIFLAFLGLCASGWHGARPWFSDWGPHNNDFFNTFGMPEHDSDRPALSAQIPANSTVEIQNPRGDVSITAGDGQTIEVQSHVVAYADSDNDAKKVFDEEAPHLTVQGGTVLVKSESNTRGRVNLTVTVPRSAKVAVDSGWDDVTAAGLGNGIDVTARGDIHLNSIIGPVVAHFTQGRHDAFSAHDVQGDVTLDGDVDDITISAIKGRVIQSGDIPGDVHIEDVSGSVHLHTSVTDLQLEQLPGDITLDNDDLRVTEAKGAVHLVTRSKKDVDLSQIYGDTFVENKNGNVSVEPAGAYSVEAKDSKGDVEVTLPPNASAVVDGHTRNGDIVTEYALTVSGEESKTVSGKIGSGSTRITLNDDNGDLRIKKGPAFPATPPPPAATPETPAPPNARHLKAPTATPPKTVTQ
jgi:DUF4097 and DUF4098 domain-containing protein YvlB